ncbi:HAMP domain-containing sensor histidine kinase [Reichenbachiella sp. MALMAid0571]|uniref:sensor histidine kinase n=1 Tax=Reichenbachiella sp. MALMAid0571 TaxID=3143939 RepID=UPI0032E03D83
MEIKKTTTGNLFLKLSLVFFFILLSIGVLYFYLSWNMAEMHFMEKNQKLNAGIAQGLIDEIKPFSDGKLSEEATHKIMHSMMGVNPYIEVYLLGSDGKILDHVAPYKKVKLEKVNLTPIHNFIATKGAEMILGDDPRNPGKTKVFSAAQVEENGQTLGYVYVILASEEYDTISEKLAGSYFIQLAYRYGIITLVAALLIGILAIWFITKNLQKVIDTVNRFRSGEMSARIKVTKGGEINQLAESFNEMADTIVGNIEDLKSMENLRRELVGNVSHDLRTPLAVIHGYIETLMIKKDNLSEDEQSKYLNRALESTEKLKGLVEELFELSKLEAKHVEPIKEPFFINELMDDISQKYSILANAKGIKIKSKLDSKPCLVYADVRLIERVLQNLIDNAIKYTPKNGEITLLLNNKDNQVEIEVIDTGSGIPKDQIPFVFDRYHIGDKRISLDKNSTGLGLAIVKRILEIHDAKIQLKSKLGEGTSFCFALPIYSS